MWTVAFLSEEEGKDNDLSLAKSAEKVGVEEKERERGRPSIVIVVVVVVVVVVVDLVVEWRRVRCALPLTDDVIEVNGECNVLRHGKKDILRLCKTAGLCCQRCDTKEQL